MKGFHGSGETRPPSGALALGALGTDGQAASDSGGMTTQVPAALDIEGTFGWSLPARGVSVTRSPAIYSEVPLSQVTRTSTLSGPQTQRAEGARGSVPPYPVGPLLLSQLEHGAPGERNRVVTCA